MAEPIPVFGQPIDTLVKAQQARGAKSDIPNVITESILWLDAHQGMHSSNNNQYQVNLYVISMMTVFSVISFTPQYHTLLT